MDKTSSDVEFNIKQVARCILESFSRNMNDVGTRGSVVSHFEMELQTYVNKGDICGFQITCDDTNNPQTVVDRNVIIMEYYLGHNDGSDKHYHTQFGPAGFSWKIIGDSNKRDAFDRAMKGI